MKRMLPGLAQLEKTPEILHLLLEDVTPEEANWKPNPGRWSIGEVVEHLSHVEGHGFRSRIDKMMGEDMPFLEEYNQETYSAAGQYSGRELEDSFDHFEDQREINVEYLRHLEDGAACRRARHQAFGTISLGDLMNEWAFHDLGHIRQIAELIRAQRYYPKLGPFQTLYQVNP